VPGRARGDRRGAVHRGLRQRRDGLRRDGECIADGIDSILNPEAYEDDEPEIDDEY
jgi:hypothetical protein